MSKYPFLMSTDRYQFYADYFTIAAEAGLKSGQALYKAINPLERVNLNSFDQYDNAIISRNALLVALQSSYEQIFSSAVSTDPMKDAFTALSNHIVTYAGQSLNTYLSDNSLTVKPRYARIHRLVVGETISDINIES